MTNQEHRELVAYFRAELRRVSRKYAEFTTAPEIYKPKNMVVESVPVAQVAMSLPPCLCMPDTQAGIERRFNIARNMLTQGA